MMKSISAFTDSYSGIAYSPSTGTRLHCHHLLLFLHLTFCNGTKVFENVLGISMAKEMEPYGVGVFSL
jgi:hypothetical protein